MEDINDELSTESTDGKKDPIDEAQKNAPVPDPVQAKMDRFLTFDDLDDEEDELDLSELLTKRSHPFANYNSRIIRQRIVPKDPALDHMDVEDLLEYCRVRKMFHPRKMVVRTKKDPDNKYAKITSIEKNLFKKKQDIRDWIEENETITFPTVAVVFCRHRKKKTVPYSRVVKSYVDNAFHDTVWDHEWWLPNGKKRPGWFAIVQDHTVRAQLIFRFDPKRRGRLVIDKRFTFLKDDNRQLEPLREVFLICQKTRRIIQESGLASSGDQAEKELFGDQLPSYVRA